MSEWHIAVFFCAQCCHKVLPLVIKLVVAVLSISDQFRCRLMLETNVDTFMYFSTSGKIQPIPEQSTLYIF